MQGLDDLVKNRYVATVVGVLEGLSYLTGDILVGSGPREARVTLRPRSGPTISTTLKSPSKTSCEVILGEVRVGSPNVPKGGGSRRTDVDNEQRQDAKSPSERSDASRIKRSESREAAS